MSEQLVPILGILIGLAVCIAGTRISGEGEERSGIPQDLRRCRCGRRGHCRARDFAAAPLRADENTAVAIKTAGIAEFYMMSSRSGARLGSGTVF